MFIYSLIPQLVFLRHFLFSCEKIWFCALLEIRQSDEDFLITGFSGSSTIDLLIYQTLCYAHDDLDLIDVDDYLMKVCGQAEHLNK